MNVLLVYPRPALETPQRTPPLSILYPGAYIARRGHNVEYFDERWDHYFDAKVKRADVVGVSAMSGYQLGRAIDYLQRAHDAGKVTVMGGVHCTIAPRTCITEPYIDHVVIGEGEETLVDLLDHLDTPERVPGIWTKTPGSPYGIYTGDRPLLDAEQIESPIDDKTLRYFRLSGITNDIALPASRGCPYSCTFCINSTRTAKKWRALPLNSWTSDIDRLLNQGIAINFFQVGDDWIGPEKRIIEIARILGERSIPWHPSLRITQVNENLANILADSKCEGVSVGIESGDQDILDLIDKQITLPEIINGATILARHGLRPFYFFIVGLPGETKEQMQRTMDMADRLYNIHSGECSIVFYGFCPQYGTKLHEAAVMLGYRMPATLAEWSAYTRSSTSNATANAIYHIAGLTFHRNKGDKTDRNFPGIRRLLILPFEILCVLRWRYRKFGAFGFERLAIRFIIDRLKKKTGAEK
jgi:anaerobic magnesium-protoporphyrin IX monomethyl ester cyclase